MFSDGLSLIYRVVLMCRLSSLSHVQVSESVLNGVSFQAFDRHFAIVLESLHQLNDEQSSEGCDSLLQT